MKNFFEIKFLLKKSKNNVVENFYYQLVMSFHNLYDIKFVEFFYKILFLHCHLFFILLFILVIEGQVYQYVCLIQRAHVARYLEQSTYQDKL